MSTTDSTALPPLDDQAQFNEDMLHLHGLAIAAMFLAHGPASLASGQA